MRFNQSDVEVLTIHNGNGHGMPYQTIQVTHVPTGLSIISERDRSQHKMRAQAIEILKNLVETQ